MSSSSAASSAAIPLIQGITLDNTLGAAFIGYSFACVIFGILTIQVFNYYQRFATSDSPKLKILVGVVWSLEIFHLALVSHAVYHYTISLFGSLLDIFTEPLIWSLVIQVLIAAISGSIVKVTFVVRVWRVSHRNILITGVIATIVLVQFGFILGFTIESYQLTSVLELSTPKIKTIGSLALATGALADALIALSLSFYLRKMRTGFTEPDSLVNRLTSYAVNTGALTSTMSLLTLILFDAKPHTFQFMGVYFVLSKTFAVSFMCTLNTRKQLKNDKAEEDAPDHSTTTFILDSVSGSGTVNHPQPYMLKEETSPSPAGGRKLEEASGSSWNEAERTSPEVKRNAGNSFPLDRRDRTIVNQ